MELLRRVTLRGNGMSLLDLGFGIGEFARRVRSRCRYLGGIEADPEAAAAGLALFDKAFVGDIFEGLEEAWAGPFDVIVAGDILEHLARPEAALERIRTLLAPGGALLVSLPNVANVTVRAGLLLGRFPYADRGILDRTHLRFFTRSSARSLLVSAGFRISSERATPIPAELAVPLLAAPLLRGTSRTACVLLARVAPTVFGYQFVFEAVPS